MSLNLTGAVSDKVPGTLVVGVPLMLVVALYACRATRAARNLALLILSSASGLIVADGLARWLLVSLLYIPPETIFLGPYPRMPLVGRFSQNVRYAGQNHGDLSRSASHRTYREYRDVRFTTDDFGFRNEPNTPDAAASSFETLLLGDSFAEGAGTSDEQTWSSLWRSRYGLRTYNLSMAGANPWSEYITLAIEADRLRVRPGTIVVWALFTGNDLDEPYHPMLDPARLPWQDDHGLARVAVENFRDRSPTRQLVRRVRAIWNSAEVIIERDFVDGRKVLFFPPYTERRNRSLEDIRRHKNFPPLEATVGAMAALAKKRELRVAIVLIPTKAEVYSWVLDRGAPWSASRAPSGFAVALKEISERHGWFFLDLKPFLIEASKRVFETSGELLWWRDDTHWNARGHEVAASVTYEHVVVPLRPSKGVPPLRGQ